MLRCTCLHVVDAPSSRNVSPQHQPDSVCAPGSLKFPYGPCRWPADKATLASRQRQFIARRIVVSRTEFRDPAGCSAAMPGGAWGSRLTYSISGYEG